MTVKVTKPAINVREELADLRKPSGVAGEAMLRAETPQEQFNLIGAGRRNLIINGGFDVWQRASSQTANGYLSADRWQFQGSGGTITASKQSYVIEGSVVNGCNYGLTTADNSSRIEQRIEDVHTANGKDVTVSFWIKGNSARTLRLYLIQDFGTSGSSSVLLYKDFTANTEFTKHTFTFSLPSTEGKTVGSGSYVALALYNQANETYTQDIALVQAELGKVATPFEHPRNYGEELALCQRYFQRSMRTVGSGFAYGDPETAAANCVNTNWLMDNLGFKTTMRAAPAFRNSGGAGTLGTVMRSATGANISLGLTCRGDGEVRGFPGGNVSTYESVQFSWDADAEL